LLALPPVVRGHAAAGEVPGLAISVGAAVAVALGRALEVADVDGAAVGESDREADGAGVEGDDRASGCGPHALTATMPRARASAP